MESGIRTQKSLESGIQRLGIRNPALGIRNPPYDWIPLHGANGSIILDGTNRNLFLPRLANFVKNS